MHEMLFRLWGESILDKYVVKLYPRAYRDLDEIYTYIADTLLEPNIALKMIDELENTIFNLETFPQRGSIRRIGAYANQDYRQLFFKKYTIIYCVVEEKKEVHVLMIRYSTSNF